MPVLLREDGIQFALRCYRESLVIKKPSLFRKEILLLARSHGSFVRLFLSDTLPNKQVEAVFSRDVGYLFGETVWHYFNKPTHLIYCEVLPQADQYVLVVVHHGRVLLDTRLNAQECRQELSTFASEKASFQIYTYGDVPLSTTLAPGKIYFSKESPASYTVLTESLIPKLPVLADLMLLNVEQAVDQLHLDTRTKWLTAIAIAGVVIGIWFLFFGKTLTVSEGTPEQNPIEQYRTELTAPLPGQQMLEVADILIQLYDLPGWEATQLNYTAGGAQVNVRSLGQNTEMLLQWAKAHHIGLSLLPNGVQLFMPSKLMSQKLTTKPENRLINLTRLIDRVKTVLPGQTVTLGDTANRLTYQVTTVTIALDQASPDVLVLLGRVFQGLPIKILALTTNVDHGLISGTLQIVLLGN